VHDIIDGVLVLFFSKDIKLPDVPCRILRKYKVEVSQTNYNLFLLYKKIHIKILIITISIKERN